MDYYSKYIKYKIKYLKKLNENNITSNNFSYECLEKGYNQHKGECWNDSIQTIITLSYPFAHIQKKILFGKNGSKYDAKTCIDTAKRTRSHLLPLHIVNKENEELFNSLMKGYLDRLFERFEYIYIDNLNDQIKNPINNTMNEGKQSVTCSINGIKLSEINRLIQSKPTRANHGGSDHNEVMLLHSLSYVLLENNDFINFDIYTFKKPYINNIHTLNNNVHNYFAIQLGTNNHAFNVYKCSASKLFYYDDNNYKIYEFDWISYFKKDIEYTNDKQEKIKMSNINDYDYYHIIDYDNDSSLGYLHRSSDELIIYNYGTNTYKSINSQQFLHINQSNDISLITHAVGLFIDNTNTKKEYSLKLNLNKFLYANYYDTPAIRLYANENFSYNEYDTFKLISAGFELSDNNMIRKLYNPTYKNLFLQKDYKFTHNYYYYCINIKTMDHFNYFYDYFKTNAKEDYDLLIHAIALNENIYDKIYEQYFSSNVTNKNIKEILLHAITSENYKLIVYFIENNINGCIKFKIDNKLMLYYILSNAEESMISDMIELLCNKIKNKDNRINLNIVNIINQVDESNDNILTYIFELHEYLYFINIMTNLFKIKKYINIFEHNDYFFLLLNVEHLREESIDKLIEIIKDLQIRIDLDRINKIIRQMNIYIELAKETNNIEGIRSIRYYINELRKIYTVQTKNKN